MRYLLCILLSMPFISYSQADQLRAVIIVGDLQDGTVSAIKEMEEIHSFFKSKNAQLVLQKVNSVHPHSVYENPTG